MNFYCYKTTLNNMRDDVYDDAVAHGLWGTIDHQTESLYGSMPESRSVICRRLAADRIASEVTELRESASSKSHFKEELADVIIMALSVAGKFGIDIGEAVETKRAINQLRSYRHEDEP